MIALAFRGLKALHTLRAISLSTRRLHSHAFLLNMAKMDRLYDDLIYHRISNILNKKAMPDMC